MNKIPVGKTIAYAYSFTFGHVGTIIGLAWLPLVCVTVLKFLSGLAGNVPDDAAQAPVERLSQGIGGLAVFLLTFLLYAIIYVAVTRQALGLRQGGATVHIALGMPEFRMFGALLLFFAAIFVFVSAYAGVVVLLAVSGNPAMQITSAAISLVAGAGLVYAAIRLSFLLVPVTVVENHISLGRGWTLTQGNFWRIFAVLLAITIPIAAVSAAGEFAVMGKELLAPIPAAAAKDVTALFQYFVQITERHTPALIGLQLILAPFSLGLDLGAAAFAYRALAKDVAAAPAA